MEKWCICFTPKTYARQQTRQTTTINQQTCKGNSLQTDHDAITRAFLIARVIFTIDLKISYTTAKNHRFCDKMFGIELACFPQYPTKTQHDFFKTYLGRLQQ